MCNKKNGIDKSIEVLDKGYVKLIDYMGSDARICEAARTSTNSSGKDDAGLIDYLMRHRHTSPFEFVVFTFKIKCPIFVFRHIVRHRTASINETSGRYSVLNDEFWFPGIVDIRKQSSKNMQMTKDVLNVSNAETFCEYLKDVCDDAGNKYNMSINSGVCREQARTILPVNIYTTFYWKIDLHNLLHFLRLRVDEHSQKETRDYANAIASFVKDIVPISWQSFEDHILMATTFSNTENKILFSYMKELGFSIDEYNKRLSSNNYGKKISNNRIDECIDKIKKWGF